MKREHGFTVIEIIVVTLFLAIATTLLFMQRANVEAVQRDTNRKTAINAMYYSLEEVFYEQKGYYPPEINSKVLRSVEPELFTDPNDIALGDPSSNYRYEAIGCDNSKCSGYNLRADLEKEDDYVKSNRNQ